MPPPLLSIERSEEPLDVIPVLPNYVRGMLLGIVLGLVIVFVIAWRLKPYTEDGSARQMETHRQLGLPPCTFYLMTDMPCPSCGMTTSFALLIRGDVWNSLRANQVGTLLAGFLLLLIPWAVACAVMGRTYFIVSLERGLVAVIVTFLTLLLLRWGVILGLHWWGKLQG